MACGKCKKPIVKADRGNITLGNPDGFDHIDCGKAAYIKFPSDVIKEKPIVISKEVKEYKKPLDPSCDSDDSAFAKEEMEEVDKYTKPIKKGGRDSVFKRRLS